MHKNIEKVINAFLNHKAANGDAKRTCSTDGEVIKSYSTVIARRLPNGLIWLTTDRHSLTTGMQIDAVRYKVGGFLNILGTDGEVKYIDKLIIVGATFEDFAGPLWGTDKQPICGHGREEYDRGDELSPDHCWGNAEMMRACVDRWIAENQPKRIPIKRTAAERGEPERPWY